MSVIVEKLNPYDCSDKVIKIARQFEDGTRAVTYDLSKMREQFGAGTWEYVYKRPDGIVYVPENQSEILDNAVCILELTDTCVDGIGFIELRYYPATTSGEHQDTYKTRKFNVEIVQSLGSAGIRPDPIIVDIWPEIRRMLEPKQDKNDIDLETESKTIVGAINELHSQHLSGISYRVVLEEEPESDSREELLY